MPTFYAGQADYIEALNTLATANQITDITTFGTQYLGSKSADPTLDNQGNTLIVGALYWNTNTDTLMAWTGSTWITSASSISATAAAQSAIDAASSAILAANNSRLSIGSVTEGTTSATITGTVGSQLLNLVLAKGNTGTGVTSITRTIGTGAPGATDTYTVLYTDATTSTYTITNPNTGVPGRGISTVIRTTGMGASGTTDIYTITYSDSTTSTFNVYNGADGAGVGDMLKSDNLSGLVNYATARTNLGLGNVTNTSDASKPISIAQQTALDLKANLESPTFTGTVNGITAAMVGAQVAGTYATGTGSATGTNTGDNAVNSLYSGLVNYTHPVNHPASIITQDASNRFVTDAEKTSWNGKQTALVSGTSIKTLNGESLLGSGNIVITGGSPEVRTPANVSPATGATIIVATPTLTGSSFQSLYGVDMTAAQWQVSTVSNFASTVISTGDVVGTSVNYTVSSGVLSVSTLYYWRVRYKDANGVYSAWSTGTSFTTASAFSAYIATPTATPAAFGDALEGGFYAGMIWNEVVQSSSSKTLATGTQTFTVPDMNSTPLVYAGQTLEVRSRANPANKFIGTVTGVSGTTLTLNVTSVGGSGTFTDWSIMAQYRVIVAPKATGENTSIAFKNANTAAPTACITLCEGRKATLAMVAADTSTVYPAAHWCNNLSIAGKTDWYLPARDELELCWRNLKPGTENNYTTARADSALGYKTLGSLDDATTEQGANLNSSPKGAAYTTTVPAQTAITAFRTGGAEAFAYGSFYYWSASEYSATDAWLQLWFSSFPGGQNGNSKTVALYVRAVRRSII